MKKLSKTEAQKEIEDFFKNIRDKTPKQIRKIKRLAMKHSIKLKEKRKLFCKKCYSTKLGTLNIKNKIKAIQCKECSNISRMKLK